MKTIIFHVSSPTGPADQLGMCHRTAAEIVHKGFRHGNSYYPAHRITVVKVVEDE